MSRARVYMPDTLAIQERYFSAVNELNDEKKLLGGLSGFLELQGIDRRHWYAQRADMGRGYFEVAWLLPLIRYYKVSTNWLLFGIGSKFKKSASTKKT